MPRQVCRRDHRHPARPDLEEIDLNSMKTVQQYGSGICQPKERRRRAGARLENLPVARGRRSLASTCMQPVLG
jgi:hypothetical protein